MTVTCHAIVASRYIPAHVVGVLLVSFLVISCAAPAPPGPAAAPPSEWNAVIAEQTGGADPLTDHGTNAEFYVVPLVLEPLFHIALLPDGKGWGVVNDLAETWRFSDSKTLVVELKKGVKFHNGEELTAEHVKYVFDAIVTADKPLRRTVNAKPLGQAEVVDQYTIKFNLPKADLTVLGQVQYLLIPPLARKTMTAEQFESKPIGTGPYKVVEWPRDGTVKLEAWDGYRKGKPKPDRLTIRYVPDPSTRVLELLSGNAQLAQAVPTESLGSIESNPKLEVVSLKSSSALSYLINLFKTTPPLRDKRVRQAMNYAVDREAIVRSILGGHGTTLPGPLWPGFLGYTDDVKPYAYDPNKAKALLQEAGFPDGFSFTWTVTQGVYPKDIDVAQAVANQLAAVGIKATLQPLERARLLAERNEGGYDVTELVWPVGWLPSALYTFTLGISYPDEKLTPRWGATPPELVEARRLLAEAAASTSVEDMAKSFGKLNRHMHDEAFWLFVHTWDQMWAIQKDIGWRPYPTEWPLFYDAWALEGKKAPSSPNVPLVLN